MTYAFDSDALLEMPEADLRALLGGKGAELNVMAARLGMPVPPAFTISTEACRRHRATGWPDGLQEEIREHVRGVERRVGRGFGDESKPLLVSVRSGGPVSMPGMMDTILNLGLNDATERGLAAASGSTRFAADCRRRLDEMFHRIVGIDTPGDPWDQLRAAVDAVFRSWDSPRARAYREREGIPDDLGTAVTVQAMVFGNRGPSSATGVLFTRDPATGERALYGDVMFESQGEDVVAGTHRTSTLADLERRLPAVAADLARHADALERHHADMCDIEFTVEEGRLWLLQCRIGKRSPQAALRIAVEMAEDEAFPLTRRQAAERVAHLLSDPPISVGDAPADAVRLTSGLPASPGVAAGQIAVSADAAIEAAQAGRSVILVRTATSPDDVAGMAKAAGLLTATGGLASHAAVVARGWGIPAVVGAADLVVRADGVDISGRPLVAGHVITVNGSTGDVFDGSPPIPGSLSPEVQTLRAWASELGTDLSSDGGPDDDAGERADVPIGAADGDAILVALAVKGFATPEALADATLAVADAVQAEVGRLSDAGLIEEAAGALRLTATGREAARARVEADRDRLGRDRAEMLLDAFVELDRRTKEVVTAWQVRDVDGAEVPNDHADHVYDQEVLGRLSALQRDAASWLAPLAAALPRYARYRERLQRAARNAAAGDARYVASPRLDSYHSAWFELHEDLILLAGRTREDEVAAGRA